MSAPSLSTIQSYLWIATPLTLLLTILSKYIYRLTLHPLAKYPGPKLAAATSLYGASFDLSPSSSYVKTFPALHDRYGPIVRVWPNHLHINDINTYDQIFKIGSKFEKHAPFYANPWLVGSFAADTKRETALPRRNLYAPSFNREGIRRAESRVSQCTAKFLDKLNLHARTGKPVNMENGFLCLMADGVMNFVYQENFGALDAEDFDSDLIAPVLEFVKTMQFPTYFPSLAGTILRIIQRFPEWALERWFKGIVRPYECLKMCHNRIDYLISRGDDRPPSVFDTTLSPNVDKGQYTPPVKNLVADAFIFFMAGTGTAANTMEVALFNLLDGPAHMLERLMKELREAISDEDTIVGWAKLEELPYLRAVIKESLRLSYGAPGRLPRVVPQNGAVFCGEKIPAGTIVSSCIYTHNMDPSVFPFPEEFRPERWLDGDPVLDQHMCSFSRGSRGCIGMNLAYCELYLSLAHLLRRFDMKLYKTTREDMEWKDCFAPMWKGSLRVTLTKVKN